MADLLDLLDIPPDWDAGMVLPESTQRKTVEIAVPGAASSLWGVALWGTDVWTTPGWVDITPYVRGIDFERGAEELDGRPRVGVATITLDNTDYRFSPVDPTNSFQSLVHVVDDLIVNSIFAPGTVIRIANHDADADLSQWDVAYWDGDFVWTADGDVEDLWTPEFTGVVESWPEAQHELGKESFIEVIVVETMSTLAELDENALVAVEGNDDTAQQRVERLADAAEWPFGYRAETASSLVKLGAFNAGVEYLLASTDMADNRLAEIYLTADSVGGVVRSDRSGKMYGYGGMKRTGSDIEMAQVIVERGPFTGQVCFDFTDGTYTVPNVPTRIDVDPEGMVWDNDNANVINVAQIARAGGTVQEASDAESILRMKGRRTYARNDLIHKSDTLSGYLAEGIVAVAKDRTLRLREINVNGYYGEEAINALITLDVHSVCSVILPTLNPRYLLTFDAQIGSMRHQITPNGPDIPIQWTATYTLCRQGPVGYFDTEA